MPPPRVRLQADNWLRRHRVEAVTNMLGRSRPFPVDFVAS